ncbi:MAG: HlyD family efflux transporter periplasmic adaptor subunit [Planctomycetota bacterium]
MGPKDDSGPLSGVLAVQCKAGGADAGVILRCVAGEEPVVEAQHRVSREAKRQVAGAEPEPLSEGWWSPLESGLKRLEPLGPAMVQRLTSTSGPPRWAVALWAGGDDERGKRVEVFALSVPDERELRHRVRLLELSRSLIDLRSAQIAASEAASRERRAALSMDVLDRVNAAGSWRGAALALCNELARRFDAERVSLGLVSGDSVRLQAASDTEDVKRRMSVARDIEAAMEECVDQNAAVPYPCDPSLPLSARSAGELAERHGARWVLTVPIRALTDDPGQDVHPHGAVTLEREIDRAFDDQELALLQTSLSVVTPRLLDLYEHDRWFGARWARRLRRVGAQAVGPRHTWAKLTAIGLAVGLAVVTIGRGTDWVEGTFAIEPVVQRVVPAPMAGYLSEVNVEPGDPVVGGETVLGRLDASELEVERARLIAKRSAAMRRADMAWREGDAAERQVALAEADEVKAELDLVDYRLEHATLIAPIDGVVVAGEWRKELGRPVEQGMVMFEVAPLDRYRAVMWVPESRIFDVWEGQTGELASASSPGQRLAFEVERVHPVAEVQENENVFPVKLRLIGVVGEASGEDATFEPPAWVRSRVQGVAKADAGRKPWLWLWTRDAVNWVRMQLWW